MATFTNARWDDGWNKSREKYLNLVANHVVENRTFFQQNSVLMIEFTFDNGAFIVLPMKVLEKLGIN